MAALNLNNPVVMGILNTTPDSFSDGGQLYQKNQLDIDTALKCALQMQAEGAVIIDIGGESTRPGAAKVSLQEELDRTIPLIESLHQESDIVISIDTSKAAVMSEALKAGATFINDVCALQNENALEIVSAAVKNNNNIKICLMHMQGQPQTMQSSPEYNNITEDISHFLQDRIQACENSGIAKEALIVDPGFGFGKTLEHNLQLIRELGQLQKLGCPVLAGISRKSMIGTLTGNADPGDRLAGSLALAWACLERGAKILRVHDVKETVEILKIFQALSKNK